MKGVGGILLAFSPAGLMSFMLCLEGNKNTDFFGFDQWHISICNESIKNQFSVFWLGLLSLLPFSIASCDVPKAWSLISWPSMSKPKKTIGADLMAKSLCCYDTCFFCHVMKIIWCPYISSQISPLRQLRHRRYMRSLAETAGLLGPVAMAMVCHARNVTSLGIPMKQRCFLSTARGSHGKPSCEEFGKFPKNNMETSVFHLVSCQWSISTRVIRSGTWRSTGL